MDAPSPKLAARIIKRLMEAKILREDDARTLSPKLTAGKMSQDDWRLAVEKALEKKDGK
ncbi:MAG: hypothetical protein ACREFX_02705 [Opitutaceae bacterium]